MVVFLSSQQPAHGAGEADGFIPQNQPHQSRPQRSWGIFNGNSKNDSSGPEKPNGDGSDGDYMTEGSIPKYPKTESIEETERYLSNIDELTSKLE